MSKYVWSGGWTSREPSGPTHSRTRTIITSSGGIMRGKFPSRKNGRMVHHEGMLELAAVYLFEASPSIESFREQPTRFTYPDGDRVRRYTPDFELVLRCGAVVWVEVKPAASLARDEVLHKINQISLHMKRKGITYVVLDDQVLRQEPRLSNVKSIWHRAPAHRQPFEQVYVAVSKHASQFPLPIQEAEALLAPEGIDVYSLMLMGLAHCDLDESISLASMLNLSTEANHEWFSLSSEHGF